MQPTLILLIVYFTLASALPSFIVKDEHGNQLYLSTVLSRPRRDKPVGFGGGFASKGVQSGMVGFENPNGSGAKFGYTHAKQYGHDVHLDAMVPVWSNKNRYGESTLNLGGGVSQHFGGFSGSHLMDKRVGLNFVHRF